MNEPFILKLEAVASGMSPEDAAVSLVDIANRLDLMVQAEINKIKVSVSPGADSFKIKAAYLEARDRKLKFIVV